MLLGHKRITSLDSYDPDTDLATKVAVAKTLMAAPRSLQMTPLPGPSGLQGSSVLPVVKTRPETIPEVSTDKPFEENMLSNDTLENQGDDEILFDQMVQVASPSKEKPQNARVLAFKTPKRPNENRKFVVSKRKPLTDITNAPAVYEDEYCKTKS